jgi:Ca2+:H+ antiporter
MAQPTTIDVLRLKNSNPQRGRPPILLIYSSGSSIYLRYSIMSFEVAYLNFTPCVILAAISAFQGEETALGNGMFGSMMGILGAIPCAYMIGICVDSLSHSLGLVLGAILNSVFLTIVELILYYFSLQQRLADVVRAAVTGAFLMNLLIIPGFGMLAAGLKWHDVVLNKKSQTISGTFLLLSVLAVLFPSAFYHFHATTNYYCASCNMSSFFNESYVSDNGRIESLMNCTQCNTTAYADLSDDPVYQNYASTLMAIMACGMPIFYCFGVFFSLKTHAHIYEPEPDAPHEHGPGGEMGKGSALAVLILATLVFCGMAHVITDKIPTVIEELGLSERFVGLVFYTLIPNAAEYMNAIKFALNGNIGLSMEIGNQGAILTALIEMPALVLLSVILHSVDPEAPMFTLIFPLIDIFCVIIAVLLRNSILTEKVINYFTGTSFLIIFLLISVVYYFEFF